MEKYLYITDINHKSIEIYLDGFESLEGSENGHAVIWWRDENKDKHHMTTLVTTKEILNILKQHNL